METWHYAALFILCLLGALAVWNGQDKKKRFVEGLVDIDVRKLKPIIIYNEAFGHTYLGWSPRREIPEGGTLPKLQSQFFNFYVPYPAGHPRGIRTPICRAKGLYPFFRRYKRVRAILTHGQVNDFCEPGQIIFISAMVTDWNNWKAFQLRRLRHRYEPEQLSKWLEWFKWKYVDSDLSKVMWIEPQLANEDVRLAYTGFCVDCHDANKESIGIPSFSCFKCEKILRLKEDGEGIAPKDLRRHKFPLLADLRYRYITVRDAFNNLYVNYGVLKDEMKGADIKITGWNAAHTRIQKAIADYTIFADRFTADVLEFMEQVIRSESEDPLIMDRVIRHIQSGMPKLIEEAKTTLKERARVELQQVSPGASALGDGLMNEDLTAVDTDDVVVIDEIIKLGDVVDKAKVKRALLKDQEKKYGSMISKAVGDEKPVESS